MKLLLLLFLCVPALAAPLPPMPVAPTAQLKSPRDASQPRSAPMKRTVKAAAPLTEPAPTMWVGITNRINFTGCNTNDLNCVLWFGQYVSVVHPAGTELTIEFADTANAEQWAFAARFGAGPVDRISEFTWFQPEDQRPPKRFFKSRTVVPILPSARGSEPVNIVSPAFLSGTAVATSRKK